MRIGIIGAGAIGCLFAAMLSRAGSDVILVHRDPGTVSEIRRFGLTVKEPDGRTLRARVPVQLAPAPLRDRELVLILVKAYDTEEAAHLHKTLVHRGATILTLQNGLGNMETLSRIFKSQHVAAGSTSEASLSIGPGQVVHTGRGQTWLGDPSNGTTTRLTPIEEFRRAGFRTDISRNIAGVLWSKVIVNAAINPVSALTGLPNGKLNAIQGVRKVMLRVVEEGIDVSQSEKVTLERDPKRFLLEILRSTTHNKSSMLQDVLRKRKTEIRQLNGAIVDRAAKHRILVPVNETLTSLILGLESGWAQS